MNQKSTVSEIRARFNNEVERFSNLETGQTATMDAALVLALIAECAARVTPNAGSMLDVGCGAGNYTLKILSQLPNLDATLVDLSPAMLARARKRVCAATSGKAVTLEGDLRELDFGREQFDIVVASAVLHHLREASEWEQVFLKLYHCLKLGGSIWISDLVSHSSPEIQALMWERYGGYLSAFKGDEYRDAVYAYIEREDTPAPVLFQCDLLRKVGFHSVEILHKNAVFCAFCAIK